MLLIYLLSFGVLLFLCCFKKKKREDIISVYFGVPGSGKTTFAAYLAKKDLKRKQRVFSNVPITGCYQLSCREDLGKYMIEDARIIIDEASVEYNNRFFKTLDPDTIYLMKYHRHYELAMDFLSQSHDDIDITIRRLAQRYYVVKKSIFPFLIRCKAIGRRIGIDKNTHQIIDEYFWKPFGSKWIFSPPLWRMFNTLSRKELPEKEWDVW